MDFLSAYRHSLLDRVACDRMVTSPMFENAYFVAGSSLLLIYTILAVLLLYRK